MPSGSLWASRPPLGTNPATANTTSPKTRPAPVLLTPTRDRSHKLPQQNCRILQKGSQEPVGLCPYAQIFDIPGDNRKPVIPITFNTRPPFNSIIPLRMPVFLKHIQKRPDQGSGRPRSGYFSP